MDRRHFTGQWKSVVGGGLRPSIVAFYGIPTFSIKHLPVDGDDNLVNQELASINGTLSYHPFQYAAKIYHIFTYQEKPLYQTKG